MPFLFGNDALLYEDSKEISIGDEGLCFQRPLKHVEQISVNTHTRGDGRSATNLNFQLKMLICALFRADSLHAGPRPEEPQVCIREVLAPAERALWAKCKHALVHKLN